MDNFQNLLDLTFPSMKLFVISHDFTNIGTEWFAKRGFNSPFACIKQDVIDEVCEYSQQYGTLIQSDPIMAGYNHPNIGFHQLMDRRWSNRWGLLPNLRRETDLLSHWISGVSHGHAHSMPTWHRTFTSSPLFQVSKLFGSIRITRSITASSCCFPRLARILVHNFAIYPHWRQQIKGCQWWKITLLHQISGSQRFTPWGYFLPTKWVCWGDISRPVTGGKFFSINLPI